LVKLGDLDGALAAYHQALALQPDFPEVQLEIAELYRQQGRYDRLLATIDRLQDTIAEGDACPSRAHMLRGIALHQLQRYGDAQRCFQDAIASDPNNPEPHLHLASLLLEQGDAQAARAPLQQAIALSPQSPGAIALAKEVRDVAESAQRDIASGMRGRDQASHGVIGQIDASKVLPSRASQARVSERPGGASQR
jgi:tetratricopeptide (TPR) repeat protein